MAGRSGDVDARRSRAFAAFEAALEETPAERLGFLHEAMQKSPESVQRGDWGTAPPEEERERNHGRRGETSGCPLTLLALGRAPAHSGELAQAERVARERLECRGFRAEDFYAAWDARQIGWRELLRQLDQHIIHRTLGKPPRRSVVKQRRRGD